MANFYATGDATGITDFDLLLPELWADAIYGYFEASMILRPLCEDYSALVKGKGDTINIPEIAEASGLGTKGEGATVVYADETINDTNIAISNHKYIAKMFDDLAVIQGNESLFAKYARAMGYQLAKQVDTDIIVELDALGTTQTLGVTNQLKIADAETAVATMMSNNLDISDSVWIVNTTIYADLLAQGMLTHTGLTNAATSGNQSQGINFSAPTAGGVVPTFFGMPVLQSSLIGAGTSTGDEQGYCIKRGAVAIAVQQEIRVQSEYSVDFLATKVVADVIYGVKRMTTNKVMGIELLSP